MSEGLTHRDVSPTGPFIMSKREAQYIRDMLDVSFSAIRKQVKSPAKEPHYRGMQALDQRLEAFIKGL